MLSLPITPLTAAEIWLGLHRLMWLRARPALCPLSLSVPNMILCDQQYALDLDVSLGNRFKQ